MEIELAFTRHRRIAFQLSGGRDSIACLYLLRDYLEHITVYWVNTGAAFPETVDVMAKLRSMCPNFVEIDGAQPAHIKQHGIPSDLVPVSATVIGRAVSEAPVPKIIDRYTCCAGVMMIPMQQRMIADGITLVIRGQKNADTIKSPTRSGDVVDGVEYLFPIEGWTTRNVMEYLKAEHAPIPRFYQMLNSAPDCMTCSAYWEEGVSQYLKRYHFPHYNIVQDRLKTIRDAVAGHIASFNIEVNEQGE